MTTVARSRPLDGLRGVAALGVVSYHCLFGAGFSTPEGTRPGLGMSTASILGNFCVTVFFVLSGFLLFREFVGRILFDEEATPLRHYFARRFLRVYPAYWVALLGFVLLLGAPKLRGSILGLLTLTERSFNSTQRYPGIFVSWTLFIEVTFYALLPFGAALLVRSCRSRTLTMRSRILFGSLSAMAVFSLIWVWAVHRFAHDSLRLITNLPTFLGWFAAGMALATMQSCQQRGLSIPATISRLAQSPWICWGSALILNLAVALMRVSPYTGETTLQFQIRLVAQGIGAFLIILPLVLSSQPSLIRSTMSRRSLVGVGIVSYGLYLWHFTLILELAQRIDLSRDLASVVALLAMVLPTSVLIGWISFRVIEQPALSLAARRRTSSVRVGSGR